MSKIITVFGATGNQGGSVIKSVLEHPELSKSYKLRGVTRNVAKPAAVALKEKGVEMVSADLNDRASVIKAIKGSSVVFGITNFWETMDPKVEFNQGKAMADGCKEAGVERFIWSTLPYVSKVTNGKLTTVTHFDAKAQVAEYVESIGQPATYLLPGLFMSFGVQSMRKNDQGVYVFNVPFDPDTTKIPLFNPADDAGLFVSAMLLHGSSTIGMRVPGASGWFSPNEMAKTFGEVVGDKAITNQITFKQFHDALPPPVAEELTGNFQLVESPGYYVGESADNVEKAIELVASAGLRKPTTWKAYVEKNAAKA